MSHMVDTLWSWAWLCRSAYRKNMVTMIPERPNAKLKRNEICARDTRCATSVHAIVLLLSALAQGSRHVRLNQINVTNHHSYHNLPDFHMWIIKDLIINKTIWVGRLIYLVNQLITKWLPEPQQQQQRRSCFFLEGSSSFALTQSVAG